MIHYDTNVTIVLNTLSMYGYDADCIAMHKDCFERLGEHLIRKGTNNFSSEEAQHWFDMQKSYQRLPNNKRQAVSRLCDVYDIGHVSGSHINIFTEPSNDFASILDTYQKHVDSSDYCLPYKDTIDRVVRTFCQYATSNGISSCADFSYTFLDEYDLFIHERGFEITNTEGRIYSFLDFLVKSNLVTPGYALYMHYVQKGAGRRITSLNEMREETRTIVESHRAESMCFPALDLYNSIPDFCCTLQSKMYSDSVIAVSRRALTLLYLFLDREDLGYDKVIAEQWHESFGARVFQSDRNKARRALEMYDDYTHEGDIVFTKRWKGHKTKVYDTLPQWCKDSIDPFLKMKEKEQWDESTVTMYETAIVRFSKYLVLQGLTSYSDLTPEIIKQFHVQDEHATPEAKNAYRCRIIKYLEWMERRKELPYGISNALPRVATSGERIIEVLSEDDLRKIEERRKQASTPIQLRDAAIIQCGLDLGFRSCDIVALRTSDIRWKDKLIRIIQDKTEVEHWTPMSNAVGNALYKYIKEGRPKVEGETHVFLSMVAPFGPIKIYCCEDAMKRYGFSTRKFHSVRRTFGTNTMKSGATIDETANALGHTDTGNVHKYTLLDQERMQMCCLTLEEAGIPLKGGDQHA